VVLVLLQGCQQLSQEVLHLYLVPASSSISGVSLDDSRQLAAPVIKAFNRLHPTVRLHVQVVHEDQLEDHLRQGHRRGLGPDLLLLRSSRAIALHRKGLIDPVPATPAFRERETTILPQIKEHLRDQGALVALPVASEVTLACYDRQRISAPPQTVDQLLALAASGATMGLALDPIGLWWTIGAFGATDAMVPLVYGDASAGSGSVGPAQRPLKALEPWLEWLRLVALQSRVDVANDQDELLSGLIAGRLAWVPCYSPYLLSLEQKMGDRLGVSALPAGPAGPASPYMAVRGWAFGRDSSPRQRRLAEELALLSLNPMLQRQITLANQSTLPVNGLVAIPFADSGRLAALGQAQQQVLVNRRVLALPFSADRLEAMVPRIEELVYEVVTGVLSPRQGAEALLQLERRP
jgi:arabinogalactan oligomer / maltooligosaccharide transport system substrate-binding protein